ncbi:hypothetical protein [Marilutibacter chinensis]|uniref:DUF4424 domain-containing protein n=1 Tax=Marilutibacter chinensis TaxID=2912247 RepID=A0ABS9HU49_9GAMM|nr:hypothetical protein [Lysobacter chinensis]MCF7221617.1 hypothetical protein [Lysobacter chinensis]
MTTLMWRRIAPGLVLLSLVLGMLPASGLAKERGRTVPVDPSIEMEITSDGLTLRPANPLRTGEFWIVPAGTHRVAREAQIDGRRYALIPLILENKAERRPFYAYVRGYRCDTRVRHYAAVDVETFELQPKTWLASDEPCDSVDYWDKGFRVPEQQQPVKFTIRQQSVAEANARRALAGRQAQEAQLEQKRVKARANAESAPAKRQIGASLCTVRHGLGYAGYTEQANEQTGRIRIRIVRNFNPANGQFLLQRPLEESVWEHPDNWNLCDF